MKNILNKLIREEDKGLLKKTGVYKITNTENQKVYIGSTSKKFSTRLSHHIRQLLENKHHSKHLQYTYNKYQKFDIFQISILEICEPQDCLKQEQKWIDFYKSYIDKFGYNISPTAGSCSGIKKSEMEKMKIFERRRKLSDGIIINIFHMRNELNYNYTKISKELNITKAQVGSILTRSIKYKFVKEKYNLKLKKKFKKEFTKEDVIEIHKLYEIDKFSVNDISNILNKSIIKLRHLIYNQNIYKDERGGLIFNIEKHRKNKIEKKKAPKEKTKKSRKIKVSKKIISIEQIQEIFDLKYKSNLTEESIAEKLQIRPKEVDLILTFRYQRRKYNKMYLEIKTKYNLRETRTTLNEQDIINIFTDYNSGEYLIEDLNEKYKFCDIGPILNNGRSSQYYKDIIKKNNLKINKQSTKNHVLKSKSITERNIKSSKTYKLTDPDGNEIIIKNLEQFCRGKNLHPANLSRISKNGKKYKGWKCLCLD